MSLPAPAPSRPPARGRFAAWAEVLRAPLLLSPLADTLAGGVAAVAGLAATGSTGAWRAITLEPEALDTLARRWLLAGGCGVALLAGGMALNALVDLPQDRRTKPERPLPRGALRPAAVAVVAAAALATAPVLALGAGTRSTSVAVAIVLVVGLYHAGGKRRRLPGCALLGLARGLDLALGACAVHAALALQGDPADVRDGSLVPPGLWPALVLAGLYALYIAGASLHASTDDEPGRSGWSPAGLGLAGVALAAVAVPWWRGLGGPEQADWITGSWLLPGPLLAAWGLVRLARAARRLPAPAVTGVALSGLHVFLAAGCVAAGAARLGLAAAGACLGLMATARALFRRFPPS